MRERAREKLGFYLDENNRLSTGLFFRTVRSVSYLSSENVDFPGMVWEASGHHFGAPEACFN